MTQPVFLIATQRSGTNYLRSLLQNTGLFHDFGEIFNITELDNDAMSHQYFLYYRQRLKANSKLSIPNEANVRSLFSDYLSFLKERAGDRPFYILDVKYSSLHHWDTIWQQLFGPNFIFKLIAEQNIKVLHLVRSNFFQVFVSHQLALHTGLYHHTAGRKNKLGKIHIEPKFMFQELNRMQSELIAIRQYLWPIESRLEIEYAELCAIPNKVPEKIRQSLSSFFGQELPFKTEKTYKKMIKDPFVVIKNNAEIEHCLAKSSFKSFLSTGNQD